MIQKNLIDWITKKKNRCTRLAVLGGILILALVGAGIWTYETASVRVWVNGQDITALQDGTYSMTAGEGSVQFDPETRTLTLTDAQIDTSTRGAAIYSHRDLNVVFEGENSISGDEYGIYAGSDLTLTGEACAEITAETNAVHARGSIEVTDHVTLILRADEEALVSKKDVIELAPLYTILDENEAAAQISGSPVLRLCPPVRLNYVTYGGGEIPGEEFPYGTSRIGLPAPTRAHFDFQNWYSDNAYQELYEGQPLVKDTTLYALWERQADAVLKGIDVSRHNKEIDWKKVADSGIQFAIIRAGFRGYGETGSLNTDEKFEANIKGAKEAGILTGVYFYSQAVTEEEAVDEAETVLNILSGRELDLPVFFDVEYAEENGEHVGRLYDAKLTPHEQAMICKAFCDRIEAAGHRTMVYANCGFLSTGVGEELERMGVGIWLAHWCEHTYYDHMYDFWQYTSDGAVPGIDGRVDMNTGYLTTADYPEVFETMDSSEPEPADMAG